MKKITILLLMLCGITYGQTLQMPNIPAEGVTYSTVSQNAIISIDQPWNYSSLNPIDVSTVSMQLIEDSQYSPSLYPNATHVKYSTSGDQDVVQFPGFTETGYSYNGELSIIENNYDSPLIINPYPFTVGDTHSDAIYQVEFTCPVCPPYMFRDHEVTSEAMASGPVTMPDGTVHENVVLIYSIATFSDAQTGSSPCVTTRESVFFWSEDFGIPIIESFYQSSAGACSFDDVQFTRFLTGVGEFSNVCQPSMDCSFGDGFQQFTLAEIDNSSGCEGFGDFTDQVANLDPGSTYDLTVTTGYGQQYMTVWIDYNDDLQFTSNEKVVTDYIIGAGQNGGTFTETVALVVPSDATPGEHRMRAKTNWNAPVPDNACEISEYGETEDYTANIGTLGVNDEDIMQVRLFPNPVDGNFVTIQTPINGTKEIEVFDLVGKRVINTNLMSDSLDVSELNTGIYMVKVTIENLTSTSKLIIK